MLAVPEGGREIQRPGRVRLNRQEVPIYPWPTVSGHRSYAPKAGQTVVVSAASGAVGGVVGQLAKVRGARSVGFAGGPDKCRYVTEELGFDACIDYKQHPDVKSLSRALKEVCPDGIDGHFEN